MNAARAPRGAFTWTREPGRPARWTLAMDGRAIGQCVAHGEAWRASYGLPRGEGHAQGRTAKGARLAVQRELDRRSIGLLGLDHVTFSTEPVARNIAPLVALSPI